MEAEGYDIVTYTHPNTATSSPGWLSYRLENVKVTHENKALRGKW